MSYNVTSTKVKEINNLRVPFKDLADGLVIEGKIDGNQAELYIGEGTIKGEINVAAAEFVIKDIQIFGEGSGHFMLSTVTPLLEKSKGYLKMIQVWEGGDSIIEYVVQDGKVTESEMV